MRSPTLIVYLVLLSESAQAAPLTLRTLDGTSLRLVELRASIVIEGPVASTKLELAFENPLDRELEGRFSMHLPTGAAVSRFAMRMSHGWEEAKYGERSETREAYERFLRGQIDPALLEMGAGSSLQMRVYPIAARERKRLRLTYHEPVLERPYRLALRGLPALELLRVTARIRRAAGEWEHRELKRWNHAPAEDFVLAPSAIAGLRRDERVVVRLRPTLPVTRVAPPDELLVLVDTSASMAPVLEGLAPQLESVLRELVALYGKELRMRLICFDQQVEELYRGPAVQLADTHVAQLLARGALGASDLSLALRWIAGLGEGNRRVLLLSDGVVTAGAQAPGELASALGALRGRVRRLDVLLAGEQRDEQLMRKLAIGVLPEGGVVLDPRLSAAQVAARLSQRTYSGLAVTIPGAEWVFPRQLDGLPAGDSVLLYAMVRRGPVRIEVRGPQRGHSVVYPLPTRPAHIEQLWETAHIARLRAEQRAIAEDPELRDLPEPLRTSLVGIRRRELEREIELYSSIYRVLDEKSALLVREPRLPRVVASSVEVRGALDKGIIRRVVHAHFAQIRHCYERELTLKARPEGRVLVQFTLGPSGEVLSAALQATTLQNPAVEACVLEAIRTWHFPAAHGGGYVTVSYPFAFRQAGSAPLVEKTPAEPAPPRAPAPAPCPPPPPPPPSYLGLMAPLMARLAAGRPLDALELARRWRAQDHTSVAALLALGRALEGLERPLDAARAYGSIIDLEPAQAEYRRVAAMHLEEQGSAGLALALEAYRVALQQRPDQVTGYRALAYALFRAGDYARAFATIAQGLSHRSTGDEKPVLAEDLGLIAAAWLRREPARRAKVLATLSEHEVKLPTRPVLRFILSWESEASRLDLEARPAAADADAAAWRHVRGKLWNGYGPASYELRRSSAEGLRLYVSLSRSTPGSHVAGRVQVLCYDGRGQLLLEQRPFLLMQEGAELEVGAATCRSR